jgi:hypothetical protein
MQVRFSRVVGLRQMLHALGASQLLVSVHALYMLVMQRHIQISVR